MTRTAVKLYYLPGAGSLAAQIVLQWTGEAYEAVRLDRCSLARAEFLSLSPRGSVPLLLHRGVALTDSASLLSHLADVFPHLNLLGDGTARSRAEVMHWLAFLKPSGDLALPLADGEIERVRECLRLVDARLHARDWLTGARSIADACLFAVLRRTMVEAGLQDCSNLHRFVRRLHEDTGVRAALAVQEGIGPDGALAHSPHEALRRLEERIRDGESAALAAEISGAVEYRLGEGMAVELRRGMMRVEATAIDAVLSWTEERYRGEAAMPFENFSHYVMAGSIRLLL
jgi:glutathione S-transferase